MVDNTINIIYFFKATNLAIILIYNSSRERDYENWRSCAWPIYS